MQDLAKPVDPGTAAPTDPSEDPTLEIEYEDSQNPDPEALTPTVVKYVRRVKAEEDAKMTEEDEEVENGEEEGEDNGECTEEEHKAEDEEVDLAEPKNEQSVEAKREEIAPPKRLASKVDVKPKGGSELRPTPKSKPSRLDGEEESLIDLMAGCHGSPDSDMEKKGKKRAKPTAPKAAAKKVKCENASGEVPPEPISPANVLDSEEENVAKKDRLSCVCIDGFIN